MANWCPLAERLLSAASDKPVAWSQPDQFLSWSDFQQKVKNWVELLSTHSGKRWVLYQEDPVEFAAALLALWQLGRVACLPGDTLPATCRSLQNKVDGTIGTITIDGVPQLELAPAGSNVIDWHRLDEEMLAVEIFTSGSSGEPELVPKTLGQLARETETLEQRWPADGTQTLVLSTVSHQHIYGLLFRILWPLCSGRIIARQRCEYGEDIIAQSTGAEQLVLVSSPSHLKRLPQNVGWEVLSNRWQSIFTSTAPLSRELSLQLQILLGTAIFEVYGSSETGGIAWRNQQLSQDTAWQPFDQVNISVTSDNTVLLHSPHLRDQDQFQLPDQIEQHSDGTFRLIGRQDRIAKIEGKRVSLTAIEQCLLQQDFIAETKVISLDNGRVITAVAVVLNDEGIDKLAKNGKSNLVKQLRFMLKDRFEPVVLPRKWRFIKQLPENAQGKVTTPLVASLFAESSEHTRPKINTYQQISAQEIKLSLGIPSELIYFDGHFPDLPILAGVVQIQWAQKSAKELLGIDKPFAGMEAIKFQQVMQPDDQVTLHLHYKNGKLNFKYQSEKGSHAAGRLLYHD